VEFKKQVFPKLESPGPIYLPFSTELCINLFVSSFESTPSLDLFSPKNEEISCFDIFISGFGAGVLV
jgi:hypothetical protein